jgi:2-methylisocitrate lyase-like PEP mutase family enzyme
MIELGLKQRLRDPRVLVAPGIADTLSAVLAERAAFEAVFLSGSAMAYTHLGRPDIGLLSLGEITSILARITERIDIPVFVDADSGFGNAYHVHRSVRALERAGASCIQIEDQVHDQHPNELGKRPVIPLTDMQEKLRAALDARRSESTLISARSDAVFSESVDAALERAVAYADVGVDIVFVEGLGRPDERKQLVELIGDRVAILFNTALPTGDKAPDIATLQTEGFSIALSPATVISAATAASEAALATLASQSPGLDSKTSGEPTSSSSVSDAIRGGEFIENYKNWST